MDFTSKVVEDINAYIRFWLGDIGQDIISDETLNFIIQMVIDSDSSYTGCDVIFYSTLEVLRWLVRKQETGTSYGTGEVKSRKEKVGDVEVSTTYDVGTSTDGVVGWDSILDDLLTNPSIIGCPITDTTLGGSKLGAVVIGGTSHEEYDRVKCDIDAKSGWELNSPIRSYLNKNKNLIG